MPASPSAAIRLARPHYWVKNLLIFLPALVADVLTIDRFWTLCLAVAAFGCAASANYIINDLVDRRSDSEDPAKRQRPIAAGTLGTPAVAGFFLALIAVAAIIALLLPVGFGWTLAAYFTGCVLYSLVLKRIIVVDILILVVLYDLRLVAGAEAVAVPQSPWLLAVGTCVFAALALTKRGTQTARPPPGGGRSRLAYSPADLRPVIVAAVLAIVASAAAAGGFLHSLEHRPDSVAAFVAIVLALCAWLARLLFLAVRGRLPEDMVRFTLTDPFGGLLLAFIAALWFMAT